MPTYVFMNEETNEQEEYRMKMSELDDFKANNKHLRQMIIGFTIGDPVALGRHKIDDGFKEVLTGIGERSPGGHNLVDHVKNKY